MYSSYISPYVTDAQYVKSFRDRVEDKNLHSTAFSCI